MPGMVWITLAIPMSAPRSTGRRIETTASGRLIPRPRASAVRLTSTWLPR
jgi:hypothetical protein